MIEAIEVQERRIKFSHPVIDGIWLGIGLLLAPAILFLIIFLIMSIVGIVAVAGL